jgi:hypothetical protein
VGGGRQTKKRTAKQRVRPFQGWREASCEAIASGEERSPRGESYRSVLFAHPETTDALIAERLVQELRGYLAFSFHSFALDLLELSDRPPGPKARVALKRFVGLNFDPSIDYLDVRREQGRAEKLLSRKEAGR